KFRHSRYPHTPILVREIISRLNYGSLALRPAALLALLSEQTGFSSSLRGRLRPGFRRFGHPPRRRISLQRQLGNLRCQDFHLLDQQLASLHYPANLCPLFWRLVFTEFGEDLGEAIQKPIKAMSKSAVRERP